MAILTTAKDHIRLKQSFLLRARTVLFGRLAIFLLYAFLWLLSFIDPRILFPHGVLDTSLICFGVCSALVSYKFKRHAKLGRWLHFLSLFVDLGLNIFLTRKSGLLLSPLMAIHPFLTAMFLMLFHNPLLMFVPLAAIPLVTYVSLLLSHQIHMSDLLVSISMLCCLNALVIFFVHLTQSQHQRLTQSLLIAKERLKELALLKERQRIARDLHDGIGTNLSSIVMQCNYLMPNYKDHVELKPELEQIRESARESIDDMRQSIAMLNRDIDVTEHIYLMCDNLRARHKHNIVASGLDILEAIDQTQRVELCRITKEAITNALKHANSTTITVSAANKDNNLVLTIADNGQGFDKSKICKGHGLKNMEDRAQQIGASLTINSEKNQSTTLSIALRKTKKYLDR